MKIVVGAAVGLLWGALIAWLNSRITRNSVARGTANAVMAGNFTRTLIDIGALALIFLLRRVLPFSFEATIVAAAIALGLLTVLFAFRLAKTVDGRKESLQPSAEGDPAEEAPAEKDTGAEGGAEPKGKGDT